MLARLAEAATRRGCSPWSSTACRCGGTSVTPGRVTSGSRRPWLRPTPTPPTTCSPSSHRRNLPGGRGRPPQKALELGAVADAPRKAVGVPGVRALSLCLRGNSRCWCDQRVATSDDIRMLGRPPAMAKQAPDAACGGDGRVAPRCMVTAMLVITEVLRYRDARGLEARDRTLAEYDRGLDASTPGRSSCVRPERSTPMPALGRRRGTSPRPSSWRPAQPRCEASSGAWRSWPGWRGGRGTCGRPSPSPNPQRGWLKRRGTP